MKHERKRDPITLSMDWLQRQIDAVTRVSALVTSATAMPELLDQLIDLIVEVMKVEGGSLCLVDEGKQDLVFAVTRGERAEALRGRRLEPGTGIVGWAIERDQPLVVRDAYGDPRFHEEIDRSTDFHTRDILCAPLKLHDRVLGAIELVNSTAPEGFTDEEAELLCAIAAQASLVIENGRLLDQTRQRVDQLQTLLEVESRMASTLAVEELLHFILQNATRVSRSEASSILLLDPESHQLYFHTTTGEKAEQMKQFRLEVGEGIAGSVARDDRPALVRDVSQDSRFRRDIAEKLGFPTRSLLAIPLKTRDETIGVLELVNLPADLGDEEEYIRFVSGFASEAATAIERARLYELLQEKVDLANKDLREANRQLDAEKGKMEAIIECMADGVVVTDAEHRIMLINRAAQKMLGMEEQVALNHDVESVLGKTPLAKLMRGIDGGGTGVLRSEFDLQGEGAMRSIDAYVSPVADAAGSLLGVVAVLNDVTDLKEVSAMKSELVSLVSHELRSPLTAIKAVAATLLRDIQLREDEKREFLQVIDNQCDRLTRMIGGMLNVARIESGRALEMRYREGDLLQLLRRCADLQKVYAHKHEFAIDIPPPLRIIESDLDKLDQIVTNLLNNAVKYAPDGGEIHIVVSEAPSDPSMLQIAITDEGLGIPPEEIHKLFNIFERTSGAGAQRTYGTGLGLYLVKRLVEALGGEISVESTVGRGTTFRFTFPRRSTS